MVNILSISGFIVAYIQQDNIPSTVRLMNETNGTVKFEWAVTKRDNLLESFFWGYLIIALPGGRLSEIYGSKRIFGLAILFSSILTITVPFTCQMRYYSIFITRLLMGFCQGCLVPSYGNLVSKWIPNEDRSKCMSNIFAYTIGKTINTFGTKYLIENLDWITVFYLSGTVGILWSIAWFYFIYDTPEIHPRISDNEKYYIF